MRGPFHSDYTRSLMRGRPWWYQGGYCFALTSSSGTLWGRIMTYRHLRSLATLVVGLSVIPFPSIAADRHLMGLRRTTFYPPCKPLANIEPPPCTYITKTQVHCSAPGTYNINPKFAGFGCAGIASDFSVDLARYVWDGIPHTRYVVKYHLYTGNGYWKDTDGFHIDALLSNGQVYKDILTVGLNNSISTGGIQFDFGACHYGGGANIQVPPIGGPFFYTTSFDFTNYQIENIFVRVDPAINIGNFRHC